MKIDNNNYKNIKLSLYIHQIIIKYLNNNNNNIIKNKYNILYCVCKYWFNIVQKLNNKIILAYKNDEIVLLNEMVYQYHIYNNNNYIDNLLLLNENQIYQKFNNQYSIYSFNNINEIRIDLNNIKEDHLIEFILNFKHLDTNKINLNKLIIKGECGCNKFIGHLKMVHSISKYLIQNEIDIDIEIDLYSFGNYEYNSIDLNQQYSLEGLNNIKRVSLTSINLINDQGRDSFIQTLSLIIQLWRVTSLTINTTQDDDGTLYHIDYEFLINFKYLNYLNIIDDFVNLTTINNILKTNDNIVALDIAIDYSLLLDGVNNHQCQLQSHDINLLIHNSMDDWSEFCNLISKHKSLKGIILRNICKNNMIYNFSFDQEYTINEIIVDSDKDDILLSKFILLKDNQNIQLIGLDNFSKSFISNTIKSISNNNSLNTIIINSILNKTNKEIQQSFNSTSLLDAFKSIFKKDKDIGDRDSLFSVLLDILKTKSNIKSFIYNNLSFTLNQQKIIEEQCNKSNIYYKVLYDYDGIRYYYNIENTDLKYLIK